MNIRRLRPQNSPPGTTSHPGHFLAATGLLAAATATLALLTGCSVPPDDATVGVASTGGTCAADWKAVATKQMAEINKQQDTLVLVEQALKQMTEGDVSGSTDTTYQAADSESAVGDLADAATALTNTANADGC